MLEILDYKDIKITKLKPWALHFKYQDRYFFIHGGSEIGEGEWQTLYEKHYDSAGRCTIKEIGYSSSLTSAVPDYYFGEAWKKKGMTHKNLYIKRFVRMLDLKGMAVTEFHDNVLEAQKKVAVLDEECNQLKLKMYKLHEERYDVLHEFNSFDDYKLGDRK